MIKLVILALIYFTLYIIGVQLLCYNKNKRFLHSLSESYYILEDIKKECGILFMLSLMFVLPTLIIPLLENTPENFGIIPVIAIFGLMLVGAAPLFKTHDKKIHSTGAIIAAVFSFIWSIITNTYGMWIINIILLICIFCLHCNYNKVKWLFNTITFWAEMIAFYGIFLSLIYILV